METKNMTTAKPIKKHTAAENRAINSKKTPRSRRMKYALEHAGAFIVVDPELRAQLKSCEPC